MSLSLLFSNQSGGTFDGNALEEKIGATFAAEVQAIREGISNHVVRQVPSFVEENHPIFVNFLEAYYEWLEQKVNVFGRTALLQDMGDIDKTLDEYVIHFKRQFLLNFPEELATDTSGNVVDERTMLKNIKDFYQTKGSEKSYKLLFRLLYDSACDLYYPKTDILKTSDGNWVEEEAIKVTSVNGVKNFKMSKNKIEQINSSTGKVDASARVFRVHQYNIYSHEVTELFINNIVGTFYPGSEIQCKIDDDTTLKENVYGLFSKIQIDEPGAAYRAGDIARADDNYRDENKTPLGRGGSGKVNTVTLKGNIKDAVIDNAGINYTEPIRVLFIGGDGEGRGTMIPTALVKYAGYFKGNNGKLSSNKKIQDGHFYQNYSYVIKAEVSLDTYKEVLKNLIHPAGLRAFGNISLLKSIQSDMPFHGEHQAYEMPIVGHYAPYRFGTTTNLRDNGVTSGSSAGGGGTAAGGWSGGAGDYATATIIGTAALAGEDGTNFILTNTDGTTVTFHTDDDKNFGDTSSDGGTNTWELNTGGDFSSDGIRKATQALWIACKAAIDADELKMTINPSTVDTIAAGTQADFTLTQTTAGTDGNTAITLITGVEEADGETTFTGGKVGAGEDTSGTGDLYLFGYNPGSTTDYHCWGESGGKLILRGPELDAESFSVGHQVSGDTSGASGEVLSWSVYTGTAGTTIGVMHLRGTPDMNPTGWCGPAAGELGEVVGQTNGNGPTAELLTILLGNGIVSEIYAQPGAGLTLAGLIQHDPRDLPLGTAGSTSGLTGDENGLTFEAADAALAAMKLRHLTGLTAYNYFTVYHHPNSRGLSGEKVAGSWTGGIDSGISFDRVSLKTFFKMPVGWHFHSNPSSDSLYYDGSSSDSIYYSVPYGSTMGSPNFSTT